MIRVLIADDHSLIREGFKKILGREADIRVVGEAGNTTELLEFLEKNECDVLVMDISMPGQNGLEALEILRPRYPTVKVLFLSMHAEEHYAMRALKGGASGYLTKESAPDELIKAIRRIYDGRMYINQTIAEKLAFTVSGKSDKMPHENLSDREFQVLRLLAQGKSISDIADQLSVSPSTISTYRQRIAEKLNVKTTAELILYAVNNQLLD